MSTSNGVNEQNKESKASDAKYAYIIGGIVIVAIAAWGIYAYSHRNKESQNNAQQTTNQDNSNNVVSPANTSTPAASGTGAKKLSYGEAIKAYPYRFQFSNCNGNPGLMSVKKGSAVMLDNRDKVAHTIKANGQTIRIAAEDYALLYPRIVTVGEVTAENSNVTCDGGGAAVLNVEK